MIKMTCNEAAKEFGMSPAALKRHLVQAGQDTERGKKFTIREILRAVQGDLKAEKTRETRERANLLELERMEKEGELMPVEEAQKLIRNAFVPVRQRLLALPSEAATRANPSDPVLSRTVLQQWVDDSLVLIRESIPEAKKE